MLGAGLQASPLLKQMLKLLDTAAHSRKNFSKNKLPLPGTNVHRDDANVPMENMPIHFYSSIISAVVLVVLCFLLSNINTIQQGTFK